MDGITKLRGLSNWAYIQRNMFPGQGDDFDKVFIFKMSEVGPSSGVDLVRQMQPGGDLEHAWIMFDHVKCVTNWTTMACHVYDATYQRVMTIACCDFQSEDKDAQIIFWKNLNHVMARHGVPLPQFQGFMADSAQANWNAVRIVYGGGDPRLPFLVVNERVIFTGANPLRSTPSNSLSMTSKTNTGTYACNIATQYLWMRLRPGILQLEHGGPHRKLPQRLD